MQCPSTTSKTCGANLTHADKGIDVGNWQRLHLLIKFLDKLVPILKANFENLPILYLRDPDEIEVRVGEVIFVWEILNELEPSKSV